MPQKTSKFWKTQVPFEVPNFDMISKAKLDNYFTVLAIMENNLAEYAEITDKLRVIQAHIKELNNSLQNEDSQFSESNEEAAATVEPKEGPVKIVDDLI
jgi:hypothetical protein